MGTPLKANKENPISSVYREIISAESSLNMPPDPIAAEDDEHYYLSQLDGWAKHAIEHLHQAFKNLAEVEKQLSKLKAENTKLRIRIAELTK